MNKTQIIDAVAKETGIKKSMISELEDDDKNRDVGYSSIAKLAKHYGVSADWLLGLTNDPHIDPPAVDELGLSKAAVNMIHNSRHDAEALEIFSRIISSVEFWNVIQELKDIQKFSRNVARNASLEQDIDTRIEATKTERQLSKCISAPAKVLVGREYLEYAEYTIMQNIVAVVQKALKSANIKTK